MSTTEDRESLQERMAKVRPGDRVTVRMGAEGRPPADVTGECWVTDYESLMLGQGVICLSGNRVVPWVFDLLDHQPAATPEPTGDGAWIKDADGMDGRRWDQDDLTRLPWLLNDGGRVSYAAFIQPVTVLHPGYDQAKP